MLASRRSLNSCTCHPWTLLPLLGLLWGSSYFWISILNGAFAPSMLVLVRVVAASLVILPVMRLRGCQPSAPDGSTFWRWRLPPI